MVKYTSFIDWIGQSDASLKSKWIAFTKDWGVTDVRLVNPRDLTKWLLDNGASAEQASEAYQRAQFYQRHANSVGLLENRFFTSYEKDYGKEKSSGTDIVQDIERVQESLKEAPLKKQKTEQGSLATKAPTIQPVSKQPASAQGTLGQKRLFDRARLAAMAEPEPSGEGGTKEQVTEVSSYSYAFEGVPSYYTTILPYESNITTTNLPTTQGTRNIMFQIRMNSIYDILRNNSVWASNPAPVADTADASVNTPYWRDHWDQYYEYWTVLECRYTIRVWNLTKVNDRPLGVFWGYTGIQQPPLTISGGQTGSDVDLTYDTFRRWKKFKGKLVQTQGATGERIYPLYTDQYACVIQGVYKPGDGTHQVVEDELSQTWIRGNDVPKEQNNLSVIITRGPTVTGSTAMSYEARIELEYVVQYKDQKEIWQFPRPTATANFNKAN